MKIFHVVDSGGMYGAEAVILSLIAHQRRRGHDAALISIGVHGCADKPVEEAAIRRRLPLHRVRMSQGPNALGAWRIARLARMERADILHSHGYRPDVLLGLLPHIFRRVPLVATVHGYTQGLKRMRLYRKVDLLALRRCERVVLVHDGMRSEPAFRSIEVDRLLTIENGLPDPIDDVTPMVPGAALTEFCRQGPVIGAVGRLSTEKGFVGLLDAFRQLRQPARLVILGEGPDRQPLEAAIAAAGLESRVLLPGFVAASAVLPLMDVFVLSSLTEGLPISLLEAMRAQRAIVATRVGGVPHVLQDGRCGLLVEPGNTQQLSEAIEKVLSDRTLAGQLGRAAAARALEYSSERMGDKYLRMYREILDPTIGNPDDRQRG